MRCGNCPFSLGACIYDGRVYSSDHVCSYSQSDIISNLVSRLAAAERDLDIYKLCIARVLEIISDSTDPELCVIRSILSEKS